MYSLFPLISLKSKFLHYSVGILHSIVQWDILLQSFQWHFSDNVYFVKVWSVLFYPLIVFLKSKCKSDRENKNNIPIRNNGRGRG
jgi:hypothetical protein